MNLSNLKTFIQIVESGSFSGAARALGLSQPAVSLQVKALEREFGAELMERRGKNLELTEAGRTLYREALELVEQARRLEDAMEQSAAEVRGTLRAAASTIPGEYILPALLGPFKTEYPFVRVVLEVADSASVARRTAAGEVDIGFTGALPDDPQLQSRPLCADRLVLITPPGHPLGQKKRLTPEDLAAADIVLREEGSGTRRTMLAALSAMGLGLTDLNVVVELGSTNAVVNAVASGAGISLVSAWALDCALETSRIMAVRLPGQDFIRQFYYMTRPKPLSRPVRALVDYLEKNRALRANSLSRSAPAAGAPGSFSG